MGPHSRDHPAPIPGNRLGHEIDSTLGPRKAAAAVGEASAAPLRMTEAQDQPLKSRQVGLDLCLRVALTKMLEPRTQGSRAERRLEKICLSGQSGA
jgi:hypothetical protein